MDPINTSIFPWFTCFSCNRRMSRGEVATHICRLDNQNELHGAGVRKPRPLITFDTEKKAILHNGIPCRVVMTESLISVGCSDVTPQAGKELLKIHADKFPCKQVVVIQEGLNVFP